MTTSTIAQTNNRQRITPNDPFPFLSYQGFLTDIKGIIWPDTLLTKITSIVYPDSVAGTPIWMGTHSNVSIRNGLFNVILGMTCSMDPDTWLPQSFLGVKNDNEPELLPRVMITGTLFAARTGTAIRADTKDFMKTIDPDTPCLAHSINGLYGVIWLREQMMFQ